MRSAAARSREGDAQAFPAYFEWKPPGSGISIHLSFSVMSQIEAVMRKGTVSDSGRGAEVGGVLFGRVEISEMETIVLIDDFEPVEIEYRRGPSFSLSEADKRRLERTLRRGRPHRQVAGLFRSHTRPGLYLDQDDFTLIQSYFPGSSQVFLLVRPQATKASVGGFFFWEESTIHRQSTYMEFPFSRTEILKAWGLAAGVEPEHEYAEPPARTAARVPRIAPPAWKHALADAAEKVRAVCTARFAALVHRANWRTIAAMASILVCLGVAQYLWLRMNVRGAAPAAYAPALRVERVGSNLQVRWNRDAPAILKAERGLLEIRDGARRSEVRFNANQLRTGSVAYAPAGDDVSFRLEMVGAERTVSESLRVVEPRKPAVVSAASVTAANVPPKVVRAAPAPPRQAAQPAAPKPPVARVTAANVPPKVVQAAPAPPRQAALLAAPKPPAAKRARRAPRRSLWYDDGL